LHSTLSEKNKGCYFLLQDHKLNLPSSVFQSGVEEKVGLLNRAAPHSGMKFKEAIDSSILFFLVLSS